jgi:hypothetical protein
MARPVCSNGKKGDLMVDKTYTLAFAQQVGRSLSEVFNFFSRAENLELLTPPWLGEMKQIAIGN